MLSLQQINSRRNWADSTISESADIRAQSVPCLPQYAGRDRIRSTHPFWRYPVTCIDPQIFPAKPSTSFGPFLPMCTSSSTATPSNNDLWQFQIVSQTIEESSRMTLSKIVRFFQASHGPTGIPLERDYDSCSSFERRTN